MEPIRCKTCGNPLGDKYAAFTYLRRTITLKAGENRDSLMRNRPIDYRFDATLEKVFDVLALPKYCCRKDIMTAWTPDY